MTSTPTGVPIVKCDECDYEHPVTRKHCLTCGVPSAFIDGSGRCLSHHAP